MSDLAPVEGSTLKGRTLNKGSRILGIETSCDETAAAVVEDGQRVLSSVVSSQVDMHVRFGGVVPEIASRAHIELLMPIISEAIVSGGTEGPDLGGIAATYGPGLVGALLVGVSAAKAMALIWGVPFVAVNHLEGHLYASFLDAPDLELPILTLLVSGGHTMLVLMKNHLEYELLGETVDDAAGEAFDKVARFLKLGYPGGPIIDEKAKSGNPEAIAFPRGMINDGLDFSFSGIKTSVITKVRKNPDLELNDICASFQEAVVDALAKKAQKAAREYHVKGIAIGGGVAANSSLRARIQKVCDEDGIHCYLPSPAMCTDNAAMIAAAGYYRLQHDGPSSLSTGANPSLKLAIK